MTVWFIVLTFPYVFLAPCSSTCRLGHKNSIMWRRRACTRSKKTWETV